MKVKVIIINILLFIIIISSVEFYSYNLYVSKYKKLIEQLSQAFPTPEIANEIIGIRYRKVNKFDYSRQINSSPDRQRKYIGNSSNKPILIIGCSYTEGYLLENNETFAAQLNKLTGRTVYNRGYGGSGPQLVYRQLSDVNFKKDVPDAEYIIYTFIYNHIHRQFQDLLTYFLNDIDINYEIVDDKLVEKKRPFWWTYASFTIKNYLEQKKESKMFYERENNLPLFMKTMEESIKITKQLYPNSKFVFIEYPEGDLCKNITTAKKNKLTEFQINLLKNYGFIYINAEKLIGHKMCGTEKYRMLDQDHPSPATWAELTPLILKELKIK